MNKLVIFIIPLLLLVFKGNMYSQGAQSIELKYKVNGKEKKIKSNSKILFIQNGDTIVSKVCCNKINLPILDSNKNVDISFNFGKRELFFTSISANKFLLDQKVIWELGFYKKFSNKEKEEFYQVDDFSKIKVLYYWKFIPQEYGDGTITIVTVTKN
jgi:hypothetical protein